MVQCCDITSSNLTARIFIERRVRVSDGQGGWDETWEADPEDGVWAKVDEMSGAERGYAGRTESVNLYNFFVRFRGNSEGAPYWDAGETRILFRGRYFNVRSIVDLEMKKKWLRIFVQEGDTP